MVKMAQANGTDISAWQGEPDWQKVKGAGLDFAFIKITEGTGYRANYQSQWDGAKSIGLLRGGYHFHRVGASGAAQADYFCNWAQQGELPPVVDFEDGEGLALTEVTGQMMLDSLRACLERIESRWNTLPIVYSGKWFLDMCLAESRTYNPRWLTKYPLWIANYTHDPNIAPLRPEWWDWKFYQYTSSGQVPGISGRVDLDVFNGSREELRAWAGIEPVVEVGKTDKEKLDILWSAYIDARR
jgi:lysozyme